MQYVRHTLFTMPLRSNLAYVYRNILGHQNKAARDSFHGVLNTQVVFKPKKTDKNLVYNLFFTYLKGYKNLIIWGVYQLADLPELGWSTMDHTNSQLGIFYNSSIMVSEWSGRVRRVRGLVCSLLLIILQFKVIFMK